MLAQLGPLVTALAGSMGGTTFQRHPVGTLIRVRPLPTRRRTQYTNGPRSMTAYLDTAWRTISPSVQTDWQTAADALTWTNKFGEVIRGLGYWLFILVNQHRRTYDTTLITAPGTIDPIGAIADFAADYNAGSGHLELDWSSGNVPGAERWLIYATPPQSMGRLVPGQRFRYITQLPATTGAGIDIAAAYEARFNVSWADTPNVWVRALPILDAWALPGAPVEARLTYS